MPSASGAPSATPRGRCCRAIGANASGSAIDFRRPATNYWRRCFLILRLSDQRRQAWKAPPPSTMISPAPAMMKSKTSTQSLPPPGIVKAPLTTAAHRLPRSTLPGGPGSQRPPGVFQTRPRSPSASHREALPFPGFGNPLAFPYGQADAQGERPAEEPCAHPSTIGCPRRVAYLVEQCVEQAVDASVG